MGRRAVVLLVALVLAGLAAWAVWNYLQGVRDDVLEGQRQVTVFRPVNAIAEGAEGSVLLASPTDLIVESTEQEEDLPEGAIQSQAELVETLTGKVAAGPIAGNSVLTSSQWVSITVDIIPLAELIPPGKQAMSVNTDQVRGVNGFINPGDRLNVIITIDVEFRTADLGEIGTPGEPPPEGTEEQETSETVTITRFVLQGLPVLATGRDIRPDPDEAPTVTVAPAVEGEEGAADAGNATVFTLEVTPEQAERLAYAFENGSIWLTLVPEDFFEVETTGVIINNLFEGNLLQDIFDIIESTG